MKQNKRIIVFVLLLLLRFSPATAATNSVSDVEAQERTNRALRYWLELIKADRIYVLLDCHRKEIRLAHGNAVLRNCPFVTASLADGVEDRQVLTKHLRRYRPSDPWSQPQIGRFDWEQNIVEDAPKTAALYFSAGLLLYAADIWQHTRSPALRLRAADLRALYNALEADTPLVVLPENWDSVD
jgi:hypothetical protein